MKKRNRLPQSGGQYERTKTGAVRPVKKPAKPADESAGAGKE